MKRYRLFKRNEVYYCEDIETGRQKSLRTKDEQEALRLVLHLGEAIRQPSINLQIAKGYLAAVDPKLNTRTWEAVMLELEKYGNASTQKRSKWATKCPAFSTLRNKSLVETKPEDLLKVLFNAGPSVNHFLRRYHNLALGLGWLPWPILHKKFWPPIRHARKRAITWEEHQRIIAREGNEERKLFYEILWETGASQTDAANLTAEDIDWPKRILTIHRKKLAHLDPMPAQIVIGSRLEAFLRQLPASGHLFPYFKDIDCKHRATEFHQRCIGLKIHGVSLHSYRYSWAVRAAESGMPERYAQAALGHASKAVHRAYARSARIKIPSLETYENKIIPFDEKDLKMG